MVSVREVEASLIEELATSRGTTTEALRSELGHGGEVDSLEGVELVCAVEERFGVRLADRELTSKVCSSIPRLAQLVATKAGAV
jgi:acyl carrier protein